MVPTQNDDHIAEIQEDLEMQTVNITSERITDETPMNTATVESEQSHASCLRKISPRAMASSFKKWIKNPLNMANFIWLVLVLICIVIYLLITLGALDDVLTTSTRRDEWNEVNNQIMNVLFTLICFYYQPMFLYHFIQLLRWRPSDRVELRRTYCRDTAPRPNERFHIMLVHILVHITFFLQYFCCALYWAYTRSNRPNWALYLAYGVATVSPVIAIVYYIYSPIGKKCHQTEVRTQNGRIAETSAAEWQGGLFDCFEDSTVCCLSSSFLFCLHGWNLERLGLGNKYVHISTFLLLCFSPFVVFYISALHVSDTLVTIIAVFGVVIGLFGLLYGGYWRIEMRKRFNLPSNTYFCGSASVTDCVQWFFCPTCSLAQEVRTGNFYDVEENRLVRKAFMDEQRGSKPCENGEEKVFTLSVDSVRSFSCPSKIDDGEMDGSQCEMPISFQRSSTYGRVHPMKPPLAPIFQVEEK
ncbi:uncharacterized protein [Typha latifolia]|uniref:uncharacterized protein n=1 Tax=Typha latifolia TaxID=4733 RepID=UPI003C2D1963